MAAVISSSLFDSAQSANLMTPKHVLTRYPAINKPAGIVHWLKYSEDAKNTDWVVILDADMIIRGPIIPWEIGAEKGHPVAAYYGYGHLKFRGNYWLIFFIMCIISH